MTIKTKEFAKQLEWIKQNGYTVITLDTAAQYINGKIKSIPAKSIVITADDGHKSVYTDMVPLIKKYKGKKHPLDYNNVYELIVAVVLSAQDSDRNINKLAPEFFKAFPDMKALSQADAESIFPYVKKIRNSRNKTKWLLQLSAHIKEDKNIPTTLEALTELPGIGRKSANVIMREAGLKAEGIIDDLHVVRVAPRLGIAQGTDPKKLEKLLRKTSKTGDYLISILNETNKIRLYRALIVISP